MTTPLPSDERQQRAKWDLLLLDIEHRTEQIRLMRHWIMPKALAMLALVLAAGIAAGRLLALRYPPKPQIVTVHVDQPIVVHLTGD